MDSEKKTEAEKHTFSPELEQEVQLRMEADEPGEEAIRLDHVLRLMEESFEKEMVAWEFRKELQDFGIRFGYFTAQTKEQIDAMTVMGRGKKYAFKRGGTFYVWTSTL